MKPVGGESTSTRRLSPEPLRLGRTSGHCWRDHQPRGRARRRRERGVGWRFITLWWSGSCWFEVPARLRL